MAVKKALVLDSNGQIEQLQSGDTLSGAGGGSNAVISTLSFGASFTDTAQTVVTGQSWVTSTSVIVGQVLSDNIDESKLIDFKVKISDKVDGVGYTITLYSEAEAKGDYTVMCLGV
jgi:hypothetical protein